MFQLSSVICCQGVVSVREVLVLGPPQSENLSVRSMLSGKSSMRTWLASADTFSRAKLRKPNATTPGGSAAKWSGSRGRHSAEKAPLLVVAVLVCSESQIGTEKRNQRPGDKSARPAYPDKVMF
jgi:hypothetical protein